MAALFEVILPIFLVVGAGYLVVWRGWFPDSGVDGLMTFTQKFAIPCLLFRAISDIDVSQTFNVALLGSFYASAVCSFVLGLAGARILFRRPVEDSVAIGFTCLFSNSVLLGLPITERAFGADALEANFAIVALHAPFCYCLGITTMEVVRAKASGASLIALPRKVVGGLLQNALILAALAGLLANLVDLRLPGPVAEALDLMIGAALPAALFGLGGILYRYRPEGDTTTIAFMLGIGLLVQPAIALGLGSASGLSTDALRSVVVTAAMPPGVNAYVFANMYGVARRVAASSVLIGTAATIVTGALWLTVLP